MKSNFSKLIAIVLAVAAALFFASRLSSPTEVNAAGPLLVVKNGTQGSWRRLPITLNLDRGPFGKLSESDAQAFALAAANAWSGVNTARLSFVAGNPLQQDVTGANAVSFFNSLTIDDGINAIIFDSDGSVTDALLGRGASQGVLGFAGPSAFSPATGEIVKGRGVFNGLFFDGRPNPPDDVEAEVRGTIIHEIGHFLNLDHTQVDQGAFTQNQPIMFPIGIGLGDQLRFDDRVAISTLYPADNFASTTGTIRGRIFLPDGTTQFQGANVVARNLDNNQVVTAIVSGFLATGNRRPSSQFGSDDPNLKGFYELRGLLPGRYSIEIEQVRREFSGGSGVGPLSPPVSLPGPREFFNTDESSSDSTTSMTPVTVAAGQTVENINIIINGMTQPPPTGLNPPQNATATANGASVTVNWQRPANPTLADADQTGSDMAILRPAGIGNDPVIDALDFAFTAQDATTFVFGEQLTPASYPSTLKSVYYLSFNDFFQDSPSAAGARLKMFVFNAPTNADFRNVQPMNMRTFDVTITKDLANIDTVNEPTVSSAGDFNEFVLPEDYTITSGSFFVALVFVDKGTSQLASGDDFIYVADDAQPSTAILSNNGGTSFVGTGVQLNFSNGPRLVDFGILGKAQAGQAMPPTLNGYRIYRSTTTPVTINDANRIGSVDANTTTFTDNPMPADGRTYNYVVTAVYDRGESGPSNNASAAPISGGGNTPSFTLSVSPNSQTVTAGGSTTFTINVAGANGFNSSVGLNVSSSQSSVTTSLSSSSIPTGGSATLTVNTTSSTPAGPVTLTITGNGGGITRTSTATVNVNAAPDFTISFAGPVNATRKQNTTV
ncbi:MAG: hypothetical protein JNN15_09955, partial [Blastocatellia bacterium]|nr:hypothetical protein [Blastocatellia bacterium]